MKTKIEVTAVRHVTCATMNLKQLKLNGAFLFPYENVLLHSGMTGFKSNLQCM